MRCTILLILTTVVSYHVGHTQGEVYCGADQWGAPDLGDCQSLMNDIANSTDPTLRVFDEEQLSPNGNTEWPGLWGFVGASLIEQAVQIPRIYSRSKFPLAKRELL